MSSIIRNDQAVSESVGYVLIFGVIVSCIALVLLTGSQIISDTEQQTSFTGMKQSFEVVSSDLKKTAFEGSPAMTTKVKVDYGSIFMRNSTSSQRQLVVYHGGTKVYDQEIGMLGYISSIYGQTIAIENGATVEMYGGDGKNGSIMTGIPRIYYSSTTGTLVVDVINISGKAVSQGGGVCRIVSSYESYDITTSNPGTPADAQICFKTDYVHAWDLYYERQMIPAMSVDTTGDPKHWSNATLNGVKKVVIVTYDINVEFN